MRLGLYKLPAAEVVLIRTLLRLYGYQGSASAWTLMDQPPWDALLVDATLPGEPARDWAGVAAAVLRITGIADAGRPDTIERPIRPDKLLQWLDQQRPEPPVAEVQPVAQPILLVETAPDLRYKLRRWPPSAVLRNDGNRVRLATLLSKRAFNVSELAAVSQQPIADCHAFLRMLRGTGLVDAAAEPLALPARTTAARAEPARQRVPARSFAAGLIGGLRRRLGL